MIDVDPQPLLSAGVKPGNSPRLMYAQNGQADPATHRQRGRGERDDGVQIRYTDATGQSSHRPHRGRHEHRTGSRSKSRSRSRASSASLDEMLLEATTGDDGNLIMQQARHGQVSAHPSQHLTPPAHGSRGRNRSPSNEEYLGVPQQPFSRARGGSHHSLHGSVAMSGAISPVPQGPGVPGNLPPGNQVQTYQTHIFAPPVTGAPVKKGTCVIVPGCVLRKTTLIIGLLIRQLLPPVL